MKKISVILFVLIGLNTSAQVSVQNNLKTPRTNFAVQQLHATINRAGINKKQVSIIIQQKGSGKKEGFNLISKENRITITGNDESGILYGCLALIDSIKKLRSFPVNIDVNDAPEMVLRGQCIGLQKSTYLPGRNVYEYPYTPETFPWFYNKKLWIQVLDTMLSIHPAHRE